MKTCNKCGQEKGLDSFHLSRAAKDGRQGRCRDCAKGCPDKRRSTRASSLRKYFGLTPEEYDDLLHSQDGRCALCGTHHTDLSRRLAVDHCHETLEIRGLLCFNCNAALGRLGDSPGAFARVMTYLTTNNTGRFVPRNRR